MCPLITSHALALRKAYLRCVLACFHALSSSLNFQLFCVFMPYTWMLSVRCSWIWDRVCCCFALCVTTFVSSLEYSQFTVMGFWCVSVSIVCFNICFLFILLPLCIFSLILCLFWIEHFLFFHLSPQLLWCLYNFAILLAFALEIIEGTIHRQWVRSMSVDSTRSSEYSCPLAVLST